MSVGFQTIEGVEIAHVGMNWPASSGDVTVTFEHLADAVRAAMQDPHILIPRLKLGHEDPRFNEDPAVFDPFEYAGFMREDGSPVYGRVDNLRLTEDGMVLVGDYIDVPDWLANTIASSYPNRSLEATWNVKTEGGKTYSFVITSVALLGEPLPAITCLDDLVRELTGGPEAVTAQIPVTLRRDAMTVTAEASTDAVFQDFVSEYAQGDRWFWWPCEIRVDKGYLLADDEEGHMYRVEFTVDGDGNVTYGEPTRGVLDFREVPDTADVAAAAGVNPARYAAAMQRRPKDRVRAATIPKEDPMADDAKKTLRETLGLAETATQDEVDAAAIEALAKNDPAPEAEGQLELGDTPAVPAVAEPVAASKGVTLDPPVLAQLQEDAKLGREARDQQIAAERKAIIDERRTNGFITPASCAAHLAELEKGGEIEKAHRAYLAGLTAAIVPVTARGGTPDVNADQGAELLTLARRHFGLKAAS